MAKKSVQQNSAINLNFFEDVIIYNILTNEEFLASTIEHLTPKIFTKPASRDVVQIIKDFYTKRGALPNTTEIKSYLLTEEQKTNFRSLLEGLKGIDSKFNKDELYYNTEKFIKEKELYFALVDTATQCESGDINTSEVLKRFEDVCSITLIHDLGLDYLGNIDRHIKDLLATEKYISTGFEWLDKKIGGGFIESGRALYLFAGGTNVGKSIMLGNLVCNMADQGKTVLLVSLEMSELMYAKRLSSRITKIPIGSLAQNTSELKNRVNAYKTKNPHSRIIVKEFPPSTITPKQLEGFFKKIVKKYKKIDAIVIDYLTILNSLVGTTLYEKGKYIVEQVRALSYVFECPIISAAQINRDGLTEVNPGIETLGESLGLATTPDFIGVLWQQDEEKELGVINLGICKSRFGPNFGAFRMNIDYETLTLSQDEDISSTDETVAVLNTVNKLFKSDDE